MPKANISSREAIYRVADRQHIDFVVTESLRWLSGDIGGWFFVFGFCVTVSLVSTRRGGIVAEAPPVADEARRGWPVVKIARRPKPKKRFWEPQEGLTFAQSSAKVTKSALYHHRPKV